MKYRERFGYTVEEMNRMPIRTLFEDLEMFELEQTVAEWKNTTPEATMKGT